MGKVKDLTGMKFDMLKAIKQVGISKNRYAKWECECDCGNHVYRDQIGVSNMEELKKCPFCSGEASLKVNHGFREEVISAFVRCEECGIGEWNK